MSRQVGGSIEVYQVVKLEKRRESTRLPARKTKQTNKKFEKTKTEKLHGQRPAWRQEVT